MMRPTETGRTDSLGRRVKVSAREIDSAGASQVPIDDDGLFSAERVLELLTELGRRLSARGVTAKVFVVGGAAIALAYNRHRLTRDIDAVFEPKAVIYEVADQMADDLGLPSGWLNDAVKGFLPAKEPNVTTNYFSAEGIEVGVASAPYLFAMKAAAARSESDRDDIRELFRVLDVRSADEAFAIIERFYDRSRLQPKTQFVIEELFTEYWADRHRR